MDAGAFFGEKLENFKRRFATDLLKAGVEEKLLREFTLPQLQRAFVFLKSSGHMPLLQSARARENLDEVLPLICLFGGMELDRVKAVWECLPDTHSDPEHSSRAMLWAYWDFFSKHL